MLGPWRFWVAAAVAVASVIAGLKLYAVPGRGRELAFNLLAGLALGITFQRSQFCFASAFRDLFLKKERRVLIGLVAALVVGSAGYMIIFGAWVPDAAGPYPPDTAHIGRLGWHLVLGGALFGFGMVIGGGCITGHLFRFGEGSVVAPVGLIGVLIGYAFGLAAWNPVYLHLVGSTEPWIPAKLGYLGAFTLQVGALSVAAAYLIHHTPVPLMPSPAPATLFVVGRRLFMDRWPAWVGGIVIGLVATFMYLRSGPLTVTDELGRLARIGGDAVGLLPASLHNLDRMKGCRAAAYPETVSTNAVLVLAFLAGSFMSALVAGDFRPRGGSPAGFGRAFGGGLLVGFAAMISLGCTVGTLMSGIMAFAVSGWIFLAALIAGSWAGARVVRKT